MEKETKPVRPIWGAKKIAERIDRPVRATFNLLETGAIPGRKIGRRWVSTEAELEKVFEIKGAAK